MNIDKPHRFDYEKINDLASPALLNNTLDPKTDNNKNIDDECVKDYIKKMKRESSKLEHYI